MVSRVIFAVAAVAVTAGLAMSSLAITGQLPYGEPELLDRSFIPRAFVIDEDGYAVTGEAEFDRCFRAAYGGTDGQGKPAKSSGNCAAHRLGDLWLLPGTGLTFGYHPGTNDYDLPPDFYLKRQPL